MSEKYADDAQRQRVLFELMALCGSEELERATRLVEQGLAEQQGMDDPAPTVQLAQVVQEINAIPQARKNLHDTMQNYFKEMATERMVAIRNAVRQAWIAASLRSSQ